MQPWQFYLKKRWCFKRIPSKLEEMLTLGKMTNLAWKMWRPKLQRNNCMQSLLRYSTLYCAGLYLSYKVK